MANFVMLCYSQSFCQNRTSEQKPQKKYFVLREKPKQGFKPQADVQYLNKMRTGLLTKF